MPRAGTHIHAAWPSRARGEVTRATAAGVTSPSHALSGPARRPADPRPANWRSRQSAVFGPSRYRRVPGTTQIDLICVPQLMSAGGPPPAHCEPSAATPTTMPENHTPARQRDWGGVSVSAFDRGPRVAVKAGEPGMWKTSSGGLCSWHSSMTSRISSRSVIADRQVAGATTPDGKSSTLTCPRSQAA